MYGDNPNDPLLKEGWQQFCDELKSAGELIFRDTTPANDIDRAKGLRLLARNIALGLQFHLESTPTSVADLVANCADEIVPATYVQDAERMLAATGEDYVRINKALLGILEGLSV
jgi:hypothetical protein